jgi:transcriptional regulator GlxA family with amidase domain
VFGLVELFSLVPGRLAIEFTGPGAGPVASSQGVQVTAATGYDAAAPPTSCSSRRSGHQTTRQRRGLLVLAARLGRLTRRPPGDLEQGCFEWVREQSGKVDWIAQARWVQDRDRWTSSGVAAGMDMAAALLADLFGKDVAQGHDPSRA